MSRWEAIEKWLTYLVVTIEHTANRGETSQTKSSAVIEETPPSSILIMSEESIKVTTSRSTTAHYCCCFLCCDWCVCIECPPKLSFLRRCKLLLCDWKIEWQYYIYRRFESQYYIYNSLKEVDEKRPSLESFILPWRTAEGAGCDCVTCQSISNCVGRRLL